MQEWIKTQSTGWCSWHHCSPLLFVKFHAAEIAEASAVPLLRVCAAVPRLWVTSDPSRAYTGRVVGSGSSGSRAHTADHPKHPLMPSHRQQDERWWLAVHFKAKASTFLSVDDGLSLKTNFWDLENSRKALWDHWSVWSPDRKTGEKGRKLCWFPFERFLYCLLFALFNISIPSWSTWK